MSQQKYLLELDWLTFVAYFSNLWLDLVKGSQMICLATLRRCFTCKLSSLIWPCLSSILSTICALSTTLLTKLNSPTGIRFKLIYSKTISFLNVFVVALSFPLAQPLPWPMPEIIFFMNNGFQFSFPYIKYLIFYPFGLIFSFRYIYLDLLCFILLFFQYYYLEPKISRSAIPLSVHFRML